MTDQLKLAEAVVARISYSDAQCGADALAMRAMATAYFHPDKFPTEAAQIKQMAEVKITTRADLLKEMTARPTKIGSRR